MGWWNGTKMYFDHPLINTRRMTSSTRIGLRSQGGVVVLASIRANIMERCGWRYIQELRYEEYYNVIMAWMDHSIGPGTLAQMGTY